MLLVGCISFLANSSCLRNPLQGENIRYEKARRASDFINSIGVNTHLGAKNTTYFTHFDDVVKPRLKDLGIVNVRDGLNENWSPQIFDHFKSLASDGIKFSLITNPAEVSPTSLKNIVDNVLGPTSVGQIEGPNEPDRRSKLGWQEKLVPYQKAIFAMVKSDPAMAAIPVIGPSMTKTDAGDVAEIGKDMDMGNIHPYMGGRNPETRGWGSNGYGSLAWNLQYVAKPLSADLPVVATECGLHNAAQTTSGFKFTPEDVAAFYIPRMFLYYFDRGVVRTYLYELLDDGPDLANTENNFGLINYQNQPKPAYLEVKNLIAELKDPSGQNSVPGTLGFALVGDEQDVYHTLLQKQDGTFYLAIWLGLRDWEPDAKTYQRHDNRPLKIVFGKPVEKVELLNLQDKSGVKNLSITNNSVIINVSDDVVIVRIQEG